MRWILGILFVLASLTALISPLVLGAMKNSGIGELRSIPLIAPALFFGFWAALFLLLFVLVARRSRSKTR